MTDRKSGDEPSLFDLPLRRAPGEATERGPGEEPPRDPAPEPPPEDAGDRDSAVSDTTAHDTTASDTREPDSGQRGRKGAARSRDELAFWEMEPQAGGKPSPDTPPGESEAEREGAGRAASWAELEAGEAAGEEAAEGSGEDGGEAERPAAVPAALTHRLAASLLDGGVLLVVTAGAILGAFLLGVRWRADDLPALGMFLLVFSFVYSVMPLAFWGRTPGMALARVLSRGADGGPLTFGQTALRWLAGLLTVALAGLPLLLALPALGGRSLADRLSGSHTWLQPDA